MERILERDPADPVALYGRAQSLDQLAETERSNARLEQAIFAYRAVIDLEQNVSDQLYRLAALRCIDRMRFRGKIRFPGIVCYSSIFESFSLFQVSTVKPSESSSA
jgi:hypothetical protein